jgi:hypothetical protein
MIKKAKRREEDWESNSSNPGTARYTNPGIVLIFQVWKQFSSEFLANQHK